MVRIALEKNQFSYNGSSNHFDELSFPVQIEKKQTPFTVTNTNTIDNGVFTNQANNYDWITSTANSKSGYKDDQEYLIDKYFWSVFNEVSPDQYEKLDKLLLGSHTLLCLHSDGLCKPTLKQACTLFWFPGEICLLFQTSDFIGRMFKVIYRYWLETDEIFPNKGKTLKKLTKAYRQLYYYHIAIHHFTTTTPALPGLEIFP